MSKKHFSDQLLIQQDSFANLLFPCKLQVQTNKYKIRLVSVEAKQTGLAETSLLTVESEFKGYLNVYGVLSEQTSLSYCELQNCKLIH